MSIEVILPVMALVGLILLFKLPHPPAHYPPPLEQIVILKRSVDCPRSQDESDSPKE